MTPDRECVPLHPIRRPGDVSIYQEVRHLIKQSYTRPLKVMAPLAFFKSYNNEMELLNKQKKKRRTSRNKGFTYTFGI